MRRLAFSTASVGNFKASLFKVLRCSVRAVVNTTPRLLGGGVGTKAYATDAHASTSHLSCIKHSEREAPHETAVVDIFSLHRSRFKMSTSTLGGPCLPTEN
jgi:hypothetical protein